MAVLTSDDPLASRGVRSLEDDDIILSGGWGGRPPCGATDNAPELRCVWGVAVYCWGGEIPPPFTPTSVKPGGGRRSHCHSWARRMSKEGKEEEEKEVVVEAMHYQSQMSGERRVLRE